MYEVKLKNWQYLENLVAPDANEKYTYYTLMKAATVGIQTILQTIFLSDLPREVKRALVGKISYHINQQSGKVNIRMRSMDLEAYPITEQAILKQQVQDTWAKAVKAASFVMLQEGAKLLPRIVYDRPEV